jgi:hypothetical protein
MSPWGRHRTVILCPLALGALLALALGVASAGCDDDPAPGSDADVTDQGGDAVSDAQLEAEADVVDDADAVDEAELDDTVCEMPTPPADGVAQCQCANAADKAIIDDEDIDQDDVAGDCALTHLGRPAFSDLVTQCITEGTGLSEECAACYTEHQINCSIANCLPACLSPSSAACRSCQREHCDDAFDTCTGATL